MHDPTASMENDSYLVTGSQHTGYISTNVSQVLVDKASGCGQCLNTNLAVMVVVQLGYVMLPM